jgi:hypothetical protein
MTDQSMRAWTTSRMATIDKGDDDYQWLSLHREERGGRQSACHSPLRG